MNTFYAKKAEKKVYLLSIFKKMTETLNALAFPQDIREHYQEPVAGNSMGSEEGNNYKNE